jgi:hypothetical protein
MYLENHNIDARFQLVAEDLTEDGTLSRISDAYSIRRENRLPPSSEVEELQFVIVIVIVM